MFHMASQKDKKKYENWMDDAISVFRFVYHLPDTVKRLLFMQLIDEEREISACSDHNKIAWECLREQMFRYSKDQDRDTILTQLGFQHEEAVCESIFDAPEPSVEDFKCPYGSPLPSSRALAEYYESFMVEMDSDPMESAKDQYVEMLCKELITIKDDYRIKLECEQADSGLPQLAVLNAFRSWYLDSSDASSLQNSFEVLYYWYIDAMLIDEIVHLFVKQDSCRLRKMLQDVIINGCNNDPNLLKIMRLKCKELDSIHGSKLLDLLPTDGPVDSLGYFKMYEGITSDLFGEKLYDLVSDANKLTSITEILNHESEGKTKSKNARTQFVQYEKELPFISIPKDKKQAEEQRRNFIDAFLANKKVTPIKLNCKSKFLIAIYGEIRDDNGLIAKRMCDVFRVWQKDNTLGKPNPITIKTNIMKVSGSLEYKLIQYIMGEIKKEKTNKR